jgi:hypothetical protein
MLLLIWCGIPVSRRGARLGWGEDRTALRTGGHAHGYPGTTVRCAGRSVCTGPPKHPVVPGYQHGGFAKKSVTPGDSGGQAPKEGSADRPPVVSWYPPGGWLCLSRRSWSHRHPLPSWRRNLPALIPLVVDPTPDIRQVTVTRAEAFGNQNTRVCPARVVASAPAAATVADDRQEARYATGNRVHGGPAVR